MRLFVPFFLENVDLNLNVIVYYPVYLNTELDSANTLIMFYKQRSKKSTG